MSCSTTSPTLWPMMGASAPRLLQPVGVEDAEGEGIDLLTERLRPMTRREVGRMQEGEDHCRDDSGPVHLVAACQRESGIRVGVGEQLRGVIDYRHQEAEENAPEKGGPDVPFATRQVEPVVGRHQPVLQARDGEQREDLEAKKGARRASRRRSLRGFKQHAVLRS